MPVQDRTGDDYEQILAASLVHLGYEFGGSVGKNYLHPSKRARNIIIPNTYIQPDLVIRENQTIQAILYVTHWSNTRDSKYKFWRTWEEAAQQKLAVNHSLLTINCIFEALPIGSEPEIYISSDDLPEDTTRDRNLPIQLNGWDPGIGWSIVESFDVSIIFPIGYGPVFQLDHTIVDVHDPVTSGLLEQALDSSVKTFFLSQWEVLETIRQRGLVDTSTLHTTRSRYRIGLLHIYIFYRLIGRMLSSQAPSLESFVSTLVEEQRERIELHRLLNRGAFSSMSPQELYQLFQLLSNTPVRKGANAKPFCTLEPFSNPDNNEIIYRVQFNKDLSLCLEDLRLHIGEEGFIEAIQRAFSRFDEQTYGLDEVLEDLADFELVVAKEAFVRENFVDFLEDETGLAECLQNHAKEISPERDSVSTHSQNWVFEMLLYMSGLNSSEDIQKRFRENFEQSNHKIRPHSPFGDYAKTVAFLLQGRDICEQWSAPRRSRARRTLTEEEFRTLSWNTVAQCIIQGFRDRNYITRNADAVIKLYRENKSMRFISSNLNGFYIMVDHYLGDLCYFKFKKEENEDEITEEEEDTDQRVLRSWQTDVIEELWGSRPLETWVEGISRNNRWLIKAQSSQDGNQGHKTKELAGRCRAFRLAWLYESDPRERYQWLFTERVLPKLALVLDGDWNETRKRNLYEAGWDWVGDVSQLNELRELIQQSIQSV